jgi:hypothetical protein
MACISGKKSALMRAANGLVLAPAFAAYLLASYRYAKTFATGEVHVTLSVS